MEKTEEKMDVSGDVFNEVPVKNEDLDKNEVLVQKEVLGKMEVTDEVVKNEDEVLVQKEDEVLVQKEDLVKKEVTDEVDEKVQDTISDNTAKGPDNLDNKVSNEITDKTCDKVPETVTDEVSNKDSSNNFVLTEEIVKLLKCSLCSQYLSYPPVYIISEADTKYKCGRCTVYTRYNMRAVMYENLAKFMKFPCIYKGCPSKLAWGEVREHERHCKYRTLICIAPDCVERVLYDKFAAHFKEKHIKFFQTNTMTRDNVHTKTGMVVLEKEEKCYLVFFDNEVDRFRISVCSFGTPDKQFELVFGSKEKPHSIIVSEQNIVPFNEKVHCYKCLLGECKYNFHIYRNNRKGILKHVHTKIDRDMIKSTFQGGTVTCTMNIVDEKLEAEDELDELLMSKDVIIDEVNDEEEVEKVVKEEQNSALSDMLKCPNCEEQMAPPIYECLSGHTICNSCKVKSEKCSSCESQIENTRNYILEEVVANLKLAGQENTEKTEVSDVEITCPVAKCYEKVNLQGISNHFKENHITNFHFNTLFIKDVFGYYNVDILVKDNKTYLVFFDFDDCSFGISVCSLESDQHRYEVKLEADNKKYSIISTNQKIIPFNDKEHCAKCSIGVCKIADHTFRQKRKIIFRRLTTKMARDCIRRTFRSNKMSFKITILEPRNSYSDKILRQLFECPICKDYMTPPIHQCISGHTLCNVCKSKLEKCPSCEGKIEDTRNHFLEKIAESVELPCLYESESCVYRGGIKRVAAHELDCPLKTKKVCKEAKDA